MYLAIPKHRKINFKSGKIDESPISSQSSVISDGSSPSSAFINSGSSFNLEDHSSPSLPTDNTPTNFHHELILPPVVFSTHVIRTDTIKKIKLPNGDSKINQYTMKSYLGSGAYGRVYKALTDTNDVFAIKIYNKRLMRSRWVGKRKTALSLVFSEIQIMESLNHENILQLYEVIDVADFHKIYLVIEYAEGGSIYDKGTFSEKQARRYFKQLIEALEYLHDTKKVIHRDIKPQNILLDAHDNIKLCDFGSSQFLENGKDEFTNSAGTFAFMAPELHGGSKIFKGTATDIWAAGVTLYYMIDGKTPYVSRKSLEMSEEVRNRDIILPSTFSNELINLLHRIFDRNPNTRATISEIKESEWMMIDNQ